MMGKMERGESGLSYRGGGRRGEATYLANRGREASTKLLPLRGKEGNERRKKKGYLGLMRFLTWPKYIPKIRDLFPFLLKQELIRLKRNRISLEYRGIIY